METFEVGDKVYHQNLKLHGIFDGYDWANNDSCFVEFKDGEYEDYRCVSLNKLVKESDNYENIRKGCSTNL